MATPNPKRSGNPAKRAASGSSARPARPGSPFVKNSTAILLWLSSLPRWVVPALVLALMLIGLSAPLPYALPALLLVAGLVAWLAYLSWPGLPLRGRILRGAVIVLIVGAIVGLALG